jgi:hypothetical protein
MKVGELEKAVGVVVGQLGQGPHLGNGVNGVADAKVSVGPNFS